MKLKGFWALIVIAAILSCSSGYGFDEKILGEDVPVNKYTLMFIGLSLIELSETTSDESVWSGIGAEDGHASIYFIVRDYGYETEKELIERNIESLIFKTFLAFGRMGINVREWLSPITDFQITHEYYIPHSDSALVIAEYRNGQIEWHEKLGGDTTKIDFQETPEIAEHYGLPYKED